MKQKLHVTVLSGGFSNERDISIMSGGQVFKALDRSKYTVSHIDISKKTVHILPTLLKGTDVVFIAMHGAFGEDGHMQAILNTLGIPYTGSNFMASALSMDKYRSMVIAEKAGLTIPKSLLVVLNDMKDFDLLEKNISKKLSYPVFVKPNASGSSVGAGLAKNKRELKVRLEEGMAHDRQILIQEYIQGRELTCAVVGNMGQEIKALPPVEIQIKKGFFDRKVKYASTTVELCPAPLSTTQAKQIQLLAQKAHQALGCDGVTRSDFLLKGKKFYYLETNTIPGLTENSLAPKEAKASGMTFSSYLDLQITLALKKRK